MRKSSRPVALILASLVIPSLILSGVAVHAAVRVPTGRTAQSTTLTGASAESPVDKGAWTAWYEDPRPNYGPEWHASTVDADGNIFAVGTSADQVTTPVTGDNGSFETWVLVQNPGDVVANVQLYY